MTNKIFSVFRETRFSPIYARFFADVSKNFVERYLENRASDFPDFLTQARFHWSPGAELGSFEYTKK